MARSAPYERPESTIDRETEEKSPSEIGNREEERGERREEENETGKRKGEPSCCREQSYCTQYVLRFPVVGK
jgi:hypothetical protein